MSGAVMLLMLATAGITYGWTPDGGNGVKYIIQIPPEKVEQVARSGEISSQIPAEIRGHVSEVVIRVGTGSLPRVTPTHLSEHRRTGSPFAAAPPLIDEVAAGDTIPVPIPRMDDPAELRPIGSPVSSSTAMMKPAPQGGGMNLPGGFGMTPATSTAASGQAMNGPNTNFGQPGFGQTAREAANNLAGDLRNTVDTQRQQVQQNINATADRFGDAAKEQMQSAANNVRDTANQLFSGSSSQNGLRNSPVPPASDDPRARLAQPNTGSGNPPGVEDPTAGSTFGPSFSRAGLPSTTASTPSASAYGRNASASTTASPAGDEDWYDLRNGTRRRPSTDPLDTPTPNNGGTEGIGGSNFARLPAGLQSDTALRPTQNADSGNPPARTQYAEAAYGEDTRRPASSNVSSAGDLDYDRNLTPAQAALLPPNGYSFDAENYPVDRQGYRLDRYGRRIDRQGRLLTAVDSMVDPRTDPRNLATTNNLVQPPLAGTNAYQNRDFGGNSSNVSMSPMLTPGMPGYGQSADPRLAGPTENNSNLYNNLGADNIAANHRSPIGGYRGGEDDLRSSSDTLSRAGRYDEFGSSLTQTTRGPTRTPEQIAAQPIFNALLLLSIVANIYLLFWLKNLRLQFRDMVASKRASANGTSLATGV